MKMKVGRAMKKLFASSSETKSEKTKDHLDVDLREEYAHAFRTESYHQFWNRVLAQSQNSPDYRTVGSTTAARLPSYRLFAENLIEPDQPTVVQILGSTKNIPKIENQSLLSDYFSGTAEASLLCSILLKEVDSTRIRYRSLKKTLDLVTTTKVSSLKNLPEIKTRLGQFHCSDNPFGSTASSSSRFRAVQASCSELLKRLETSRDKARAKLRLIKWIKQGSAVFLVALTASLVVVVATHAAFMLVAAPGVMVASSDLISTKKLRRLCSQLDTAAKGTYILIRDLDTVSRLVARLNDELEDVRATVRFWLKRTEDRLQTSGEVASQMKTNDVGFNEQLDDLEEHLYLCFMTINRSRNLVMKEILEQGKLVQDPNILAK